MCVKKQQLESSMEQLIGSGLRKYNMSVCCHAVCSTYILNIPLEMLDWMSQAGIKISWRNTNNVNYVDDTTLMAESKDELKSLMMKVKQESERVSLKLNSKKKKKPNQNKQTKKNKS